MPLRFLSLLACGLVCLGLVLGMWWLTVVAGSALTMGLIRARRQKHRRPTRAMSDMDHDVQERIRAIAAQSRYSSAGIEF